MNAALEACDINLEEMGMVGFLPGCDADHGQEGDSGDGDIEIEITTDDFEDVDGGATLLVLAPIH